MQSPVMQAVLFVLCAAACGGRTVSENDTDAGSGGSGGTGGTGGTGGIGGFSIFDANADFQGLSCEQQTKIASTAINDAVIQAQKDSRCASSADCMNVALAASCYSACFTWVNTAGAKLVADTIADIEATVCASFKSKGCRRAMARNSSLVLREHQRGAAVKC